MNETETLDDLRAVQSANMFAYSQRRKKFPHWKPSRDALKILLDTQQGKCAACGRGVSECRGMGQDHHHASGKARGVICRDCNLAIGWVRDDPARARKIAEYLERFV